jgi:FG-GAP-like repeat/FG-GAP repeat
MTANNRQALRGFLAPHLTLAVFLVAVLCAVPAHANGFGPSHVWSSSFSPGPEKPMIGDFNGDGKDDVISFVGDSQTDSRRGDVMVSLSTGRGLTPAAKWHDFFCMGNEVCVIGDFNGDGRKDIGLFRRDTQAEPGRGDVLVALSNGTSFGAARMWHPFFGIADEFPAVGDFNGDGRDDVVLFKRTSPGGQSGDVLVALSNGTSFGASEK